MPRIEADTVCKTCKGTGLYVGFAERDGAGIVCYRCSGTGCHHQVFEWEDFVERAASSSVTRVYQRDIRQ